MTYFLTIRFSAVFLLAVALLSGCCANNVCDCNDANADAIKFRFSTDTLGSGRGFRVADMDTIIIQRSPLPYSPAAKVETVTVVRRPAQARDSILLNNNTPFAQSGSNKLDHYRYVVQYLAHPPQKGTPTTVLVIDRIELRGSFEGSGCCTCYTNTQKTLYKNGSATGINLVQNNQVLLEKP